MARVTLRDVMMNWPPTTGAGLPDAPVADMNDVIKRAYVSQEGHLVLNLSRNEEPFAAAETISNGQVDAVRRIASQLLGKTIEAAGKLVLNTDQ